MMSMQAQHRTIEAPKLFVLGPADPLLHRFRIPQKGGSEREGKNTFYKLKLNLKKLKKATFETINNIDFCLYTTP